MAVFQLVPPYAEQWFELMKEVLFKGSLLLLGAALLCVLLRKSAAPLRHLILSLSLFGLAALPILSVVLPAWETPLPSYVQGRVRPVAPAPSVLLTQANPATTRTTPTDVEGREIDWVSIAFAVWVAGTAFFAARLLHGCWQLARLHKETCLIDASELLQVLRDAGSSTRTQLRLAPPDTSFVPMTWGWRRPIVMLPCQAQMWPPEHLRSVLLHEVSHIQRRDWITQMIVQWVCVVYWFHPLVWMAAKRFQIEAELACDDRVLAMGVEPSQYAAHLLEVVKMMASRTEEVTAKPDLFPHLESR
jgi:beta-lactamase regulating signal transducer with metallopeptidase domain